MRIKNMIFCLPLVLLAACGGDGNFYTEPVGTLTAASAGSVKGQLGTASTVSFTKPGEVSIPSRRSDADLPDSCLTFDPTTPTDADSDGIPLTQKITLNCTNTAGTGGSSVSGSGTFTITDKNDAAGSNNAGGWRFDMDGTYTFTQARNGTFTMKGFFDLTAAATDYTFASNFKTTFSGTSLSNRAHDNILRAAGVDPRVTYSLDFGSTWNHKITPADMTMPKKAGSIVFSGFWGYKITVSTRETANIELVLQGSSDGLTYDETCSNFYKTGTITFKAATGTMTYTYDCNNATVVKFDGTVI